MTIVWCVKTTKTCLEKTTATILTAGLLLILLRYWPSSPTLRAAEVSKIALRHVIGLRKLSYLNCDTTTVAW